MKTFPWTFPDPPLSKVEKRQHAQASNKPNPTSRWELNQFIDNGSVNSEGREFIEFFESNQLHDWSSFRKYFLPMEFKNAMQIALGSLIGYGIVMLLFIEFGDEKDSLIDHLRGFIVVAVSMLGSHLTLAAFRLKRSWKEALSTYHELHKAPYGAWYQGQPTRK